MLCTLCCAGGEEVILQMPRGNLEAIRPRALVLPAVAGACERFEPGWGGVQN